MKTLASAFALAGLTAGAALAQMADDTMYDYDTVAGYNEGFTEEQFGEYDLDGDGMIGGDEVTGFTDAGYLLDDLGEPTDGLDNELNPD